MKNKTMLFQLKCLLLALALTLSLAACSSKNTKNTNANTPSVGGTALVWDGIGNYYKKILIKEFSNVDDIAVHNDIIFALNAAESSIFSYENNKQKTLYTNSERFISNLAVDDTGIWIIETRYSFDEQRQSIYTDISLKRLSLSGSEVETISISGNETYEEDYGQIVDIVASNSHLFLQFERALGLFNMNGKWIRTIKLDDNSFVLKTMPIADGVCCQVYSNEGIVLKEFYTEGESEEYQLEQEYDMIFGGNNGNSLLITDEIGLYEVDVLSADSIPLIIWSECGIAFSYIEEIIPISEEKFVCLDGGQVYILEPDEYTAEKAKTIIKLATFSPDQSLRSIIIQFNQANEQYYIQIEDYYDKVGSIEDGVKLLNTQLISGTGPDIIHFGGFSSQPYGSRGFLIDLNDFFDTDSSIDKEKFIGLNCMETNGRLYTISPGFCIDTFLGLESVFGEQYSWSFDEYFEMESSLPANSSMINNITKDEFLRFSLINYIDSAIDWQSGICDFNNGRFVSILESTNRLREAMEGDDEEYLGVPNEVLVANGTNMFMFTRLDNILKFANYEKSISSELSLIGWPTADETCGSQLVLTTRLGISANSSSPEGAWEFIKYIISDPVVQEEISSSAFPVSKKTFEAQIKVLQQPFYEFSDSEIIIGENGGFYADGVFYDIEYDTTPLITSKQVSKIYGLLDRITRVTEYHYNINSIIQEEASAYFAGIKSLEDVAKIIQSKLTLYVAEQS